MKKIIMLCLFIFPLLSVSTNTIANNNEQRKIVVDVKIADNLIPENSEEWTLYVYAAMPNSRVPLANFTGKLSDLPQQVELLESMYLLPHLTLQQAEDVVVIAKATMSTDPHKILAEDIIGYSQTVHFSSGSLQKSKVTISQLDSVKK